MTQFRRVAKMDKNAFRCDLQAASNTLLDMQGANLAKQYNLKLSEIFDKHAPLITKMIIPRPKVAWFTNEARILRAKVRKREKIWRKSSSSFAFDDLKLARSAYRKHLKD